MAEQLIVDIIFYFFLLLKKIYQKTFMKKENYMKKLLKSFENNL